MKAYFIRRFLLVPITLLGVTLIVFTLTRFMPGSPIERAMQRATRLTRAPQTRSQQVKNLQKNGGLCAF
jgi:microcin C transport system permease protein